MRVPRALLGHGPLAQKAVAKLTPMTDLEYKALMEKIEREFPVRLKLAELAGRPKINVKSYKALEEFDDTIADLFLEITLSHPENIDAALALIRTVRT